MNSFLIVFAGLILTGCASRIPQNIRQAPTPNPSLAEVTSQGNAHLNQPVRWGGSILTITNHPNDTEIEILAKNLDGSGKPIDGDDSQGRFLARVDGFLDPAVYAQGRLLTLYGLVDSVVSRAIGEKPYVYPLLKTQTLYLWPRQVEYANPGYYPYSYYSPYGYSPFGYYPYGYYYGFRGGYGRRW